MQKRYKRTGYFYPQYYQVICPQCNKDAIVKQNENKEDVRLTCSNCMTQQMLSALIRYRAYVKRNCPYCGLPIYKEQSNFLEAPSELSVKCEHCETKVDYIPNIVRYISMADNKGLKCDPHFSIPLWFQTEVKGNLFWAYNREHLEEIRCYVEAELRERHLTSYMMTMVARLPDFIKDAKNRESVLNTIKKLETQRSI